MEKPNKLSVQASPLSEESPKCLKLSDIKSKFIFAICEKGSFFPCLLLGKATVLRNGFKVYFLRQDIETEIPSNNIIHDPDVLKGGEVSYMESSSVKTGIVVCLDKVEGSHTPTCFLLQERGKCVWVPLPRVFLTKQQAAYLF